MESEDYTIRRFEPGDREEVIGLLAGDREEVIGPLVREFVMQRADRWFDWRFLENPFTSEVPVTVAEADGSVVALRSSFPRPMSVNGGQTLARLHTDAVVHPDHRREGIFSRIVQADHERFSDGESTISYGMPNKGSLAALRSIEGVPTDQGIYGAVPSYYRLTRVDALGAALAEMAGAPGVARSVTSQPLQRLRGRDGQSGGGVDVVRYDGVPADLLGSLPFDRDQRAVHGIRDERFYRWRMANPLYEYSTYTAEMAGETVASVVIETTQYSLKALPIARSIRSSPTIDRVADLRPIDGRSAGGGAWEALARGILADTDAVLLVTLGSEFPREVTSANSVGSIATDAFSYVFDRFISPTFIAWPINGVEGDSWQVNGLDLTVPDNWRLLRCDLVTSF